MVEENTVQSPEKSVLCRGTVQTKQRKFVGHWKIVKPQSNIHRKVLIYGHNLYS